MPAGMWTALEQQSPDPSCHRGLPPPHSPPPPRSPHGEVCTPDGGSDEHPLLMAYKHMRTNKRALISTVCADDISSCFHT